MAESLLNDDPRLGDSNAAAKIGVWRKIATAVRVAQVRLRLLLVLALAFLVVGKWETLRMYWDRLTTSSPGDAPRAVSSNTEYFCPMDPGVLSEWPAKCPICNMALVRREKGAAAALPDGVVSRMQFSPYRLQLAGVRTATAGYRPLVHKVSASGFVQAAPTRTHAIVAPWDGVVARVHADAGEFVANEQPVLTIAHRTPLNIDDEPNAKTQDGPQAEFAGVQEVVVAAPQAGVLLMVDKTVGATVDAGDVVGTIADLAKVDATIVLSREEASRLSPRHLVQARSASHPSHVPWKARVRQVRFDSTDASWLGEVVLEIDNPDLQLRPGVEVSVEIALPVADMEPFREQPTDPEPLSADEPRQVYACQTHADVVRKNGGTCPIDGLELSLLTLADDQRLRYVCLRHADMRARSAGHKCEICAESLQPRVIAYRPRGEVLAIPEGAIIDAGDFQLAFVDRGHGMFDAVKVDVGPSVDGYRSIVNGLQTGQRIVAAGAFLLDAETRLDANAAAAYFGATTNVISASAIGDSPDAAGLPAAGKSALAEIDAALNELSEEDQQSARRQRLCPVTNLPLGSMGRPVKVAVRGQVVFLCCEGCTSKVLAAPEKYLSQPAGAEPRPK